MPITIDGKTAGGDPTDPLSPGGEKIDPATELSTTALYDRYIRLVMDADQTITDGSGVATVGFQAVDTDGKNLTREVLIELAVFTDPKGVSLAIGEATLSGPTVGSIPSQLPGRGFQAAVLTESDATGRATLALTDERSNPSTKTFYVMRADGGARIIGDSDVQAVTFEY